MINLRKLSDAKLYDWSVYWHARLESRGGSWIAEGKRLLAMQQLQLIEAEMKRRAGLEPVQS